MQRKRRKKKRFGVFLFLLVVCIGIGIMFVPWAMQPENFREVKNKINGFLYKEDFPDSYNAKSLILVDCSDDEIFVSKNENEPQIPATLPDGSTQIWQNTNAFLDPTSEYYNENVCGIKTGSLSDDYNLIVLYQQHGKEFLICSLGSQSDSSRYDDVNFILKTIDESYYLTQ